MDFERYHGVYMVVVDNSLSGYRLVSLCLIGTCASAPCSIFFAFS
jgi:hypothetical protein